MWATGELLLLCQLWSRQDGVIRAAERTVNVCCVPHLSSVQEGQEQHTLHIFLLCIGVGAPWCPLALLWKRVAPLLEGWWSQHGSPAQHKIQRHRKGGKQMLSASDSWENEGRITSPDKCYRNTLLLLGSLSNHRTVLGLIKQQLRPEAGAPLLLFF